MLQGEESAFESLTPAFAAIYAAATGESTLGYPVSGPIADAVGGRTGAALETAASYFAPYSATRKHEKEGGIVRGGRGPALAQFLGGAFAGGPIDVEKAHRAGLRDMPGGDEGAELRKLLAAVDVLEREGKLDAKTAAELRAVYGEIAGDLDAETIKKERAALLRAFREPEPEPPAKASPSP